ncbi:MAG: helix-turn-helix domain-containing protein [Pseudomonadota bacterium]
MWVRKHRLERGWSQETLAELTGLSVRTIQRIERGTNPSSDSLRALVAAFEINLADLQEESNVVQQPELSPAELDAIAYVRDIKGFYSHAVIYVIVIAALALINWFTSPSHWWFIWAAMGWGIGVAAHGLVVFEVFTFFGPDWEQRRIQQRLAARASARPRSPTED